MDSVRDTLAGGLPHSEISGSRPVCRLPGAFRRLSRLSSPVVAKAFTVCASSLDPLTPNLRGRASAFAASVTRLRAPDLPIARVFVAFALSTFVKERDCRRHRSQGYLRTTGVEPIPQRAKPRTIGRARCGIGSNGRNWWSQAGSNRRPPACKADALPAELWPQVWWVWVDSNHRPHPYQGCALTT